MSGVYAADGSLNVTVVDGTEITGFYAADGSINVIESPGSGFVGIYHPCGAMYITLVDTGLVGHYASDGSLNVMQSPYEATGAIKVTAVGGGSIGVEPDLITGSDTLSPKITDTSTLLPRVSKTDTLTPKITDAITGIVTTSTRTDTLPIGFSDVGELTAKFTVTDTLAPKFSEQLSLDIGGTVTKSVNDSMAVKITDTSQATLVAMTRTDSFPPKITEASTMFKDIGLVDTLAPKITDTSQAVTVVLSRTDSLLPKITEASTLDTGAEALPGDINDLVATPVDLTTADITFTPATAADSHEYRFSPTGQASWSTPAALPDNTGSNEITDIAA